MTTGIFTDKSHPPTDAEIRAALGARYPLWEALIRFMAESYAQADQALSLPLGAKAGKALRAAPQLRDGRWLFAKVTSRRDARDIEQLIQFKRKPAKAGVA